ncbi:unnamed protein product [Withania somnifera]
MGSILSRSNHNFNVGDLIEGSQGASCKRQRTSDSIWEHSPRLIPSLPDEISIQILARVPRIHYLNAKLVSQSWKAAIMSPELYRCRKELGTTEEWLYLLTKTEGDKFLWYAFDPISMRWQRLPPMPAIAVNDEARSGLSRLWAWNMADSSIRIADAIRGWLGRRSALHQVPFCGCAIGAVDGCLYALGGFFRAAAIRSVWRYDPIVNAWNEVSPMSTARAYCKTGVLNGKLYVVGGVTRDRGGLAPLQSAEVFNPHTGVWSEVPSMPFSKAQMIPTAFLADLLKPIATGMASYHGKLYVPQREVYDPETNTWIEMPIGMGDGWPARQAGTKLSVTVEGELYALDPSSTLDSARIKVYDHDDDTWKVIEGDIPINDNSESPYLLAGFLGKLHVITKDSNHNIMVMQADRQNHSVPSPSTSANSLQKFLHEVPEPVLGSEANMWRVVALRSGGSAELVSCQILDV